MGKLTMTLLWLAVGQAAPVTGPAPAGVAPDFSNQRELRVPINFQSTLRSEMTDVVLYASYDQGRSYLQVARVKPDKNEFVFEPTVEGECWLRVAVINRQGKQEPENIQAGPPDRRIIIDRMKPVLRTFTAQRQEGDVVVNWEILEDHFDAQGFRIEYQPKDNPGAFWSAVQAAPGLSGQTRFRPNTAAPVFVRITAKDQAGNQIVASAETAGTVNVAALPPTLPNSVVVPAGGPNATAITGPPALPPAPGPMPVSPMPVSPPPQIPPQEIRQAQAVVQPPVNPMPPVAPVVPPLAPPMGQQNKNWSPGSLPIDPGERVVANSQAPPPPVQPTPNPGINGGNVPSVNSLYPPPPPPKKPLPPLQYVNHPQVVLEYELAKVGASGIGSVELWWTKNDGQTWDLYADAPDIQGTTTNGKQARTVELPGDGVYGFTLVVKSRAGLGKPPPRPGDVPQLRFEVDTVPPLAQLYAPVPDPQRPGALILKWAAKDANLTANPITLEWAEHRQGPWMPIATTIPNDGRHSWQLPDRLPVQVYMRLRVRDLAGNESIAVTGEPQLVDLSEPEGRLLNVHAMPRRP